MTREEILREIRIKYGLTLEKLLKIVSKDDREKIIKAYNLNNQE
jgi:hypothetical protein